MGSVLGASSSIALTSEEVADLTEATNFTANEIEALYHRFRHIDRSRSGTIQQKEFLLIPELAMNPMAKRIMELFLDPIAQEANFVQFVQCLSHLHPDAPPAEKARFAFRCYDLDDDGVINLQDLTGALKLLVGSNLTDAQLAMIARNAIREAGGEISGEITFKQFCSQLGDDNAINSALSLDIDAMAVNQ